MTAAAFASAATGAFTTGRAGPPAPATTHDTSARAAGMGPVYPDTGRIGCILIGDTIVQGAIQPATCDCGAWGGDDCDCGAVAAITLDGRRLVGRTVPSIRKERPLAAASLSDAPVGQRALPKEGR